jgi:type III secretory pathway component EscT
MYYNELPHTVRLMSLLLPIFYINFLSTKILNVIFLSWKLLICTRNSNNKVQVVHENKNKCVISKN